MGLNILIVEDNLAVVAMLEDALRERGHQTSAADSAPTAIRIFDRFPCDLAILDIQLKEGTGHEVCAHIRRHASRASTPIIMLTGQDSMRDKELGFSRGADHFLTKPIDLAEFLLWVEALQHRVRRDWTDASAIDAGDLTVNSAARTVHVAGKEIAGLTAKEFALLWELARARPRTLSRRELVDRVWEGAERTNTLEVHVMSLRRKLGPRGAVHIITVKGTGYRLEWAGDRVFPIAKTRQVANSRGDVDVLPLEEWRRLILP